MCILTVILSIVYNLNFQKINEIDDNNIIYNII